jgi:hypothetical protein
MNDFFFNILNLWFDTFNHHDYQATVNDASGEKYYNIVKLANLGAILANVALIVL